MSDEKDGPVDLAARRLAQQEAQSAHAASGAIAGPPQANNEFYEAQIRTAAIQAAVRLGDVSIETALDRAEKIAAYIKTGKR